MSLPADMDRQSERSRKFYDGTYKWDLEGFTDEIGVYRQFDCSDPLARAPTPLPPMFLGDEEEEAATKPHDLGYTPGLSSRESVQTPSVVSSLPPSEAVNGYSEAEKRTGSPDAYISAAASISNGQPVAVLKGDDMVGHFDREQYFQCTKAEDSKRDFTPPESPKPEKVSAKPSTSSTAMEPRTPTRRTKRKADSGRGKGDSDSEYDFSDVPSDLSNEKAKSTSSSKSERKNLAATATDSLSSRQPTTRGVAQKVVCKPTKKASTAPVLLNMQKKKQSPPKTDPRSLRRSARQSRASGSGF